MRNVTISPPNGNELFLLFVFFLNAILVNCDTLAEKHAYTSNILSISIFICFEFFKFLFFSNQQLI